MRDIDNRICCTTVDTKLSGISYVQEAGGLEVYDLGNITRRYPSLLADSL